MARLARKQLADLRALDEEALRDELHGSGRYVGRGATPSMGLSQFRGGCEECSDSDEEYEEEMPKKKRGGRKSGGRSLLSRIPLARGIGLPRLPRPSLPLAQQGVGIGRIPLPPPTTRFPRPNLYSGRQFVGPRLVNPPRAVTSAVNRLGLQQGRRAPTALNMRNAGRISQLLAAGIPIAMLGAYLADAGGDGGGGGYYDEYAGEVGGPAGPSGPSGPPAGPSQPAPSGPLGPDTDGDGIPDSQDPDYNDGGAGGAGGLPPDIADRMTEAELLWFLQSGNLPAWAYRGTTRSRRARVGSGVLKIQHGGKTKRKPSARNEIVKKVMRERGVSLPEASKIVKAEGLY